MLERDRHLLKVGTRVIHDPPRKRRAGVIVHTFGNPDSYFQIRFDGHRLPGRNASLFSIRNLELEVKPLDFQI